MRIRAQDHVSSMDTYRHEDLGKMRDTARLPDRLSATTLRASYVGTMGWIPTYWGLVGIIHLLRKVPHPLPGQVRRTRPPTASAVQALGNSAQAWLVAFPSGPLVRFWRVRRWILLSVLRAVKIKVACSDFCTLCWRHFGQLHHRRQQESVSRRRQGRRYPAKPASSPAVVRFLIRLVRVHP